MGEDLQGRPILIGLCKMLNPNELCRAVARSDWAVENLELIEHIYSRNLLPQVRTWQLTEEIDPDVLSIIPHINTNACEIFTCKGIDLAKDLWLVVRKFEPKVSSCERFKIHETPKNRSGHLHSVLTKEEIDDFFDVSEYGEEVTFSGN